MTLSFILGKLKSEALRNFVKINDVIPAWMVDSMPGTVAALEKVRSEKRGFKKGTYVTPTPDSYYSWKYTELGRANKDNKSDSTPKPLISKEDQAIIDKANKNVATNKNIVLKYVSPSEYAQGAEKFNGKKDIFKEELSPPSGMKAGTYHEKYISDDTYGASDKFIDMKNYFKEELSSISSETKTSAENKTALNKTMSGKENSKSKGNLNITNTKEFLNNGTMDSSDKGFATKASVEDVSKYLQKIGYADKGGGLFENAKQWVKISKDLSTGLTLLSEGALNLSSSVKDTNNEIKETKLEKKPN